VNATVEETTTKNVEQFIIVYGALLFSAVVLLSLLGEARLDIYMAIFAIEFFVSAELTGPLNPTQRRRTMTIGLIFLLVFALIVARRITEILRI